MISFVYVQQRVNQYARTPSSASPMRNMVIVVIIVITGERMSSPTLIQLGLEYQKIPKIIGEEELRPPLSEKMEENSKG